MKNTRHSPTSARNVTHASTLGRACSGSSNVFHLNDVPSAAMTFLVDALRTRVEHFLGWAMLVPYSQCSTTMITEATWLMLESLLKEVGWPRRPFGGHVRRLYGMLLGAVRHLANTPPETAFPMLSRRNGGFLRPEPLRRVRVEHATVWARPIGAPHPWRDMRDAFLTRGYDEVLPRFEQDPPACAFQGWRQVTRRQLTEELFAEITTTTLRLLWRGFHIELLEQIVDFFEASESEDGPSTTSRSRSSGRGLRRQHQGLEHS